MPVSEELVTLIRAHGALREKRAGEAATEKVVPFQVPPAGQPTELGPDGSVDRQSLGHRR